MAIKAKPPESPPPPGGFEAENVRSINDVLADHGVSIVIHGPSGVGKTSMVKSLPADRTVILDVDGGVGVLAGWSRDGKPGKLIELDKKLNKLKPFVEWVTTGAHGYTTVVVDSVSLLERRMVFAYGEARGKDLIEVKEYGDASTKMRHYLLQLRDLSARGINVIFIAHTKTDVKGQEGVRHPFLSDKLALELPGLVDAVGYLCIQPDRSRRLTFQPEPNLSAKTRWQSLGDDTDGVKELNLTKIIMSCKREMNAGNAPVHVAPAATATAATPDPAPVAK